MRVTAVAFPSSGPLCSSAVIVTMLSSLTLLAFPDRCRPMGWLAYPLGYRLVQTARHFDCLPDVSNTVTRK